MKNSRAHPNYLTAALNPYVIIYAMASILSLVSRNAHFLIEVAIRKVNKREFRKRRRSDTT